MEDKRKNVTIYDIAREINVSASTVSRALNDHYSIGSKTKKAVKKLAQEMGYRPNNLASSLRTNRSNTIGIMVSWIDRPFISALISGIEKAARESGYRTIIAQSHDQLELEKENLQALFDSRISALIVSLAMETEDCSHFELFSNSGIPIVFVDRIPAISGVNKVNINNFNAAFEATEHLIHQGCRRIAHFGGARHQAIYEDRYQGYLAALEKHCIPIDEQLVKIASNLSAEEGFRMAENVLAIDQPADGIFSANDTAATSAILFCKRNGLKIPEDVAIIGFNNDPICEIIDPPLSSVNHPAREMGEATVGQVLDLLNETKDANKVRITTMDTSLVLRASSLRNCL